MAGNNNSGDDGVRSPCIALCRIDADKQWCRGCWRTLDEIAAWPTANDEEKRAIWQRLRLRVEMFRHDEE